MRSRIIILLSTGCSSFKTPGYLLLATLKLFGTDVIATKVVLLFLCICLQTHKIQINFFFLLSHMQIYFNTIGLTCSHRLKSHVFVFCKCILIPIVFWETRKIRKQGNAKTPFPHRLFLQNRPCFNITVFKNNFWRKIICLVE